MEPVDVADADVASQSPSTQHTKKALLQSGSAPFLWFFSQYFFELAQGNALKVSLGHTGIPHDGDLGPRPFMDSAYFYVRSLRKKLEIDRVRPRIP